MPAKSKTDLPHVIIHMEGGVLNSITSNCKVRFMVIDYDDDLYENSEGAVSVQQSDSDKSELAYVTVDTSEVQPDYTKMRFQRFDETDGESC